MRVPERMTVWVRLSVLALSAGILPVQAHHSVLAFDGARATTITGTVARILQTNPHSLIVIDVAADGGGAQRWTVEAESVVLLRRLGWTPDGIVPGDRVTVIGAGARDGTTRMRCKQVELAGGSVLPCFPSGASEQAG